MKRVKNLILGCLLSAVACCLPTVVASAQDPLVDYSDQLHSQHITSTIFPLADELMLALSFDEVAKQLTRKGFSKVEIEEGILKAESPLCVLRAVNRRQLPERIDTLTLYLRQSLDPDILKDSLQRASYDFMETSADQRYDWYKRADGINLAVYYVYKKPYKSAMLFARPTTSTPPPAVTPSAPAPVVTPTALTFKPKEGSVKTRRPDGGEIYAQIRFPIAQGGPAKELNAAALASPLLSSLVSKPIGAHANIVDGLKTFLHQVKVDFLAASTPSGVDVPQLDVMYDVTVQPEDETREGVITYVNHVTAKDHGLQYEDYHVAANFDATSGRRLTSDDVFLKHKRPTVVELLRAAHHSVVAQHPDYPANVDVTPALDNFILGRDDIQFILILDKGGRIYEEILSYDYDKLQPLLR